ncbi:RagB/SusD family nutrient uptake outer membrane protein [Parapedobacter deserti]|uniref:RagB/SusD family nutrient uptake outer membrane protein n=1 Tax=Parapedobacter deserti TaxID=1912957 RepID=A0ABV7JP80_9SPHI
MAITEELLARFSSEDLRMEHWIGDAGNGPIRVGYASKYRAQAFGERLENLVVLRLAELYLIRAEARLRSGNPSGARDDLNTVRRRAGIPPSAADDDALHSAIQEERQRELFAEWGHRWCDLKRWGILDSAMTSIKPHWASSSALFPIPEDQIRYNPYLTQNPDY